MDEDLLPSGMNEREIAVRRRVRRAAEFYRHLTLYVLVMFVLWVVNAVAVWNAPPGRAHGWWVIIPAFGWGIGVVMHGLAVAIASVSRVSFLSIDWEERKVKEMLSRMEENKKERTS